MNEHSERRPFHCSVPVRARAMESLHAEHAPLAIETDLRAMGGSSIPDAHDPEVLLADYQLSGWSNSIARQGSGRSGVYGGYYLKGIGRTPLAANWDHAGDWYHATGHMFPSSAVREYLTTVYLEARGLGHRIVPCRGLLLGRLDPALADALGRACEADFDALAPIDRTLCAITAKPARFARMSNFLWLVERLSGWGEQWAEMLPAMQRDCDAEGKLQTAPAACTAASLVTSLRAAIGRSLDGLTEDFCAGVMWNSLWNNFTLDGRMLDLEVAALTCRPFVGALPTFGLGSRVKDAEHTRPRRLCGMEPIDHALDLQLGVCRMRGSVRSLLELPLGFEPAERQLMQELAHALDGLARDDTLFAKDALVQRCVAPLAELSQVPRSDLEQEVSGYVEQRRRAYAQPELRHVHLTRTPLSLLRSEPTVSQALWLTPDGYRAEYWHDARELLALFARVEACTDPEHALASVQAAERAIRGRWAG